ncbi:hypothetical protein [Pseudomonas umsongensis]|uniref:hypothetical protein n=1 Tax=Pseudomonas umsongensis TaxID=198618 RepID=UPI00200AF36A|nr:hypothetical protein [Pseudomonas umsongensis]MCK8687741.1 hypothetical protein [Pseudomonas umsongensis]
MSTTRPITLSPALIDRSKAAVRSLIEELRTVPSTVAAVEYAEINGRLRTLAALGLIGADEEQDLHLHANKARQVAEENKER